VAESWLPARDKLVVGSTDNLLLALMAKKAANLLLQKMQILCKSEFPTCFINVSSTNKNSTRLPT
jgi:hypothetical protein